ncbi:hypothetical protein [Flavobacterium reichenbachii]|uniref:Uncharacterized protein n=1 Tax=Flavobacterium reichenbachii TaxID=362418 RepID=A0A085ZPG6_9FLAO|nr:hypothetical protein [Flavobacterium reichenbachii]KFF06330.1 hypothetical protein IW19_12705 [Flavobacterium reichenbachii]OXB17455.1 hypothetical protein B0A68_03930 [Flavobacterium reichenbachii]
MRNKNKEIISQIDNALLNVEMNDVTRELFMMLREEIPKAKTKEEKLKIALKLVDAITTVANIASMFQ